MWCLFLFFLEFHLLHYILIKTHLLCPQTDLVKSRRPANLNYFRLKLAKTSSVYTHFGMDLQNITKICIGLACSRGFPEYLLGFYTIKFLPAFQQPAQFLAFPPFSQCMLGQRTLDASRNMPSFPHDQREWLSIRSPMSLGTTKRSYPTGIWQFRNYCRFFVFYEATDLLNVFINSVVGLCNF